MARGRPAKPTALKLLEGNSGKRALNTNEPKPELFSTVPDPPKILGRIGKTEWKRLATELCRLRLLSVLDLTMLEVYCESYEQYRQAEKALADHFKEHKKYTVLYTNKAGHENEIPHSALRVRRDALDQMRSIGTEFGFTPSSRSRLRAPAGESSGDALLNLIKNRGRSG